MSSPRATQPPWHLWGNTQIIRTTVQLGGPGLLPQPNMNTLCRVGYGRPDTWQWVFQARLISGPNSTPGETMNVLITFNVILGMGRASLRLYGVAGTQSRPLEALAFLLGPVDPVFPRNAHLFSTSGLFSRVHSEAVLPGIEVNQIVAETIVCEANVTASAPVTNVLALGQPVEVEVSALFSPVTHIRPDWFQEGPPELQFPGGEVPAQ